MVLTAEVVESCGTDLEAREKLVLRVPHGWRVLQRRAAAAVDGKGRRG